MKKQAGNTTIKDLDNLLKDIVTFRNGYRSSVQAYLEKFINNYETTLNNNSEPLFKLLKSLDNASRVKVNMYLKSNTTLDKAIVSDKGIKLTIKGDFKIIDDSKKWYDMKIEVKPFEPSDDKLKKSLQNLLKHYTMEDIRSILLTL